MKYLAKAAMMKSVSDRLSGASAFVSRIKVDLRTRVGKQNKSCDLMEVFLCRWHESSSSPDFENVHHQSPSKLISIAEAERMMGMRCLRILTDTFLILDSVKNLNIQVGGMQNSWCSSFTYLLFFHSWGKTLNAKNRKYTCMEFKDLRDTYSITHVFFESFHSCNKYMTFIHAKFTPIYFIIL